MLVNNWKELKSSNYMGLLMETAILLLWHVLAGIVALARSAALMEAELLCGTTKGFTHSLTLLNRSEALNCAVPWDQGPPRAGDRHCCPPQASSTLEFIPRHPSGSLFHSASLTRNPLGMDRHQRHDSLPSQVQTSPPCPPLQLLHPKIQLVAKESLLWCILCCPQRKVKRNNDSYSLRCAPRL